MHFTVKLFCVIDVNICILQRTHVETYKRYGFLTFSPRSPRADTHCRRSCAVRPERSALPSRRSGAAPPFPCGSTWPGCPPSRWCSRCSPVGTRAGAPLTIRGRVGRRRERTEEREKTMTSDRFHQLVYLDRFRDLLNQRWSGGAAIGSRSERSCL